MGDDFICWKEKRVFLVMSSKYTGPAPASYRTEQYPSGALDEWHARNPDRFLVSDGAFSFSVSMADARVLGLLQ